MVGLDTNVIVRYVMQDDERQSAVANRIIDEELTPANKGFVTTVVLCEVLWVLTRSYGRKREGIADFLDAFLDSDTLEFEHSECVMQAYRDSKVASADFADCLIGHVNRKHGTSTTLAFDRDASRLEYFRLAQ